MVWAWLSFVFETGRIFFFGGGGKSVVVGCCTMVWLALRLACCWIDVLGWQAGKFMGARVFDICQLVWTNGDGEDYSLWPQPVNASVTKALPLVGLLNSAVMADHGSKHWFVCLNSN